MIYFRMNNQASPFPGLIARRGKIDGAGNLGEAFYAGLDSSVLEQGQPAVAGRRFIECEGVASR